MSAPEDQGGAIRCIWVVEDSEDDVFLMRRALKRAGVDARLIHVPGGQEAIDLLSGARPAGEEPAQLVFLDLRMPLVSGFDVLAWMQAHPERRCPPVVVMLTASHNEFDRSEAARLGAQDAIVKPPTPQQLDELAARRGLRWLRQPRPS